MKYRIRPICGEIFILFFLMSTGVFAHGDAVVVPRGAKHHIINLSETVDLKLYTIYSPPHHRAGIVRATKAEAEGNEEVFDGATTEHLPD